MHNIREPRCGLCSKIFNFIYRQKDEENLVYAVERLTKEVTFQAMVNDYPARYKVQIRNPYVPPINTPEELSLRNFFTYRDGQTLAETKQLPQNQQQPHVHEEMVHNEEYAFIQKYVRRWKTRAHLNSNPISVIESEHLQETLTMINSTQPQEIRSSDESRIVQQQELDMPTVEMPMVEIPMVEMPTMINPDEPLKNRSSTESQVSRQQELDVDETLGAKTTPEVINTVKPHGSFSAEITSQVTVYRSTKSASCLTLQSPASFYSVLSQYPDASNDPIENVITSTVLEPDGTQSESSDGGNGAKDNISRRP